MPSVVHATDQYANNRTEVSHQPTRQRERQMRRFKSAAHVQRFVSVPGLVQNLFRVGRHLLRSAHHLCLPKTSYARFEWPTALAWGRRTKASVRIADWRALEVGGWLASVGRSSGRHVGVHGLPALADRGDRQAA